MARHAGFTLLEMLVTLVVIAISLSAVTLAFKPDPRRPLAREAERLALLLEQARAESSLSGAALAWVWRADGYAFVRREINDQGIQWVAVANDELFRDYHLPDGARLSGVSADGRPLGEGERVRLDDDGVQDLAIDMTLDSAKARLRSARQGEGIDVEAGG
jgi:type II secretion system protein H